GTKKNTPGKQKACAAIQQEHDPPPFEPSSSSLEPTPKNEMIFFKKTLDKNHKWETSESSKLELQLHGSKTKTLTPFTTKNLRCVSFNPKTRRKTSNSAIPSPPKASFKTRSVQPQISPKETQNPSVSLVFCHSDLVR
ncbi:hypothetical protein A4A49_61600, partial [Nicotiana attenuata]